MQGSRISHLPCSYRVGRTGGRRTADTALASSPRGAPNPPGEHPPAAPRRPLKRPIGDTAPLNNDFVFTYPVARPGPPPGHLTYPPAATQHLPRHAGLEGHSAKINPPVFACLRPLRLTTSWLPCRPPTLHTLAAVDGRGPGPGRRGTTKSDVSRSWLPYTPSPTDEKRKTSGAQPCDRSDASPPWFVKTPTRLPLSAGCSHWGNRGEGRLTLSRS